jgi:ribonuclease HI
MNAEELVVYADGSYYAELRLGGWAFRVPQAQLSGSGVDEGDSNLHFELLAVVRGLEHAIRADGSSSPIHVVSDCQYVRTWITHANRWAQGGVSSNEVPDGDAGLIGSLCEIAKVRHVGILPFKRGDVEHAMCHREAVRLLQQEVAANSLLSTKLSLHRQRLRMADLLRQREDIHRRLLQIEEKRLTQHAKIEALQDRLARLTGQAVRAEPEAASEGNDSLVASNR